MSDRPAQPGETVESPGWTPQLRAAIDVQFARVRELWRRLDDALLAAPTPGSVSDQDHSSGDRLAACSHDLAATFLRATIDHLVTWDKLLGDPGNGRPGFQPTFAHLSLLRTAHESAWLAYWLTEPGITPDRRLARGLQLSTTTWTSAARSSWLWVARCTPHPPSPLLIVSATFWTRQRHGG